MVLQDCPLGVGGIVPVATCQYTFFVSGSKNVKFLKSLGSPCDLPQSCPVSVGTYPEIAKINPFSPNPST